MDFLSFVLVHDTTVFFLKGLRRKQQRASMRNYIYDTIGDEPSSNHRTCSTRRGGGVVIAQD